MPKKQNFADRAERLREITSHLCIENDFPLLKEAAIPSELFYELREAICLFVDSSYLASRADSVSQLLNLTPNGVLMPKRENMLEYNLVQKAIGKIFGSLAIDEYISLIQLPAMMRFVQGKPDAKKDSRPYSSTKHHIDLWNGDPPHEILVFIPVTGDVGKNGIEFFEPDERVMKDLLFPLKDYDDGKIVIASAKRYDITMRTGYIYLADSFLLHRTLKSGTGSRVSMEFRFVPKKTVAGDVVTHMTDTPDRHKNNYANPETWYSIGNTSVLAIRETFEETRQKYLVKDKKEGAYPIIYEDYFRVVPLFL